MSIKRKTYITLLIFGTAILLLIFFAVNYIFDQTKRESENLTIRKKELLESEAKIKNLQDFKANFKRYQPDLDKVDRLFADISEPIKFIEFLENEALISQLSIVIAPPVLREKDNNKDPWPAFEFSLNLKGFFPNLLRFLERLESAPYLIETVNLNIKKDSEIKDNIIATLLIRAYAK